MRKLYFLLLSFTLSTSVFLNAQVPKNLNLLATLPFPGQTLAGCWHYEDGQGNAYALVGTASGIAIVNVTVPSSPVILFQLPGVNSLWHEVKVEGQYAYAVSEGVDASGIRNGMQILDLRFLPDSVPYKFYTGDGAIANQLTKAHTVTTSGHYVYINGHNISSLGTGVLICDITDPWNPVYTGAITMNYCHDSYVRGDTIWTSDIIAGQFSVYDISNRAIPVLLATQQTPGQFNHNAWLSDDSRTLFTTDEHSNQPMAAYDVSDLSNITLLDQYFTINMPASEVHNVRVLNDFVINPSYGSQLTIVDAHVPDNLVEVANYPTGSSLCWDADPYFSSGIIAATDMNSGNLFIFQPEYIRACYLQGNITDSSTGLMLNGATITIASTSVTETSDPSGMYKTGYADAGTYSVSCSKSGYITKTENGVILSNGTVTIQDFQLSPIGSKILENGLDKLIYISPNPCNDQFTLDAGNLSLESVQIRNVLGKLIYLPLVGSSITGKTNIAVGHLPAGIYFVECRTEQGTFTTKFLKE